jgi:hypothetical protein
MLEQGEVAKSGDNPIASARSRRRDWIELAVGYSLIMAVVWTPRPWQRFLWIAAVAAIVVMMGAGFEGRKAVGLRAANFWRSLWIVGAALALAAVADVVAARMHTLMIPDGPVAFVATYCAYAIWTGVQQFLLQGFFLLRFVRVIPRAGLAALLAAGLFAAAHLPNPVLTPITLIWGFAACLLFLRYRNLYPLMLAHAILGITAAMTVPGPVVHNMRVGLGYLTYSAHRHGHGIARRLP